MIASPIPLQEKIAELEQRIVRLEEQAQDRKKKTVLVATPYSKGTSFFGPHWHKMWEEFHLAMKEIFE